MLARKQYLEYRRSALLKQLQDATGDAPQSVHARMELDGISTELTELTHSINVKIKEYESKYKERFSTQSSVSTLAAQESVSKSGATPKESASRAVVAVDDSEAILGTNDLSSPMASPAAGAAASPSTRLVIAPPAVNRAGSTRTISFKPSSSTLHTPTA